jgi:hypothetical protein
MMTTYVILQNIWKKAKKQQRPTSKYHTKLRKREYPFHDSWKLESHHSQTVKKLNTNRPWDYDENEILKNNELKRREQKWCAEIWGMTPKEM